MLKLLRKQWIVGVKINIRDLACPKGSILDGLAELPALTTRKEWFAITRGLMARRTNAEIELIKRSIYDLCQAYQPMTVRQLFYALTTEGVIDKTEQE